MEIPAEAIQMLQADPSQAGQFDEVFGENASSQFLSTPALDGDEVDEVEQPDADVVPVVPEVVPEVQPEEPDSTPPAQEAGEKEDAGILETIGDVAAAIPGGIQDSIESAVDFGTELLDQAGIVDKENVDLPVFGKFGVRDAPIAPSKTTAGQVTRGISQFVGSFIGAGKILAPIKWFKNAVGGRAVVKAGTQGAIADFLGFGAHENRLSDLLEDNGILKGPVTEYLAADETDGEFEGRFKNALEGVLLGGAVETVFRTIKLIKNGRAVAVKDGPEAAKQFVRDNMSPVEEAAARFDPNAVDDVVTAPPARSVDDAVQDGVEVVAADTARRGAVSDAVEQSGTAVRTAPAVDVAKLADDLVRTGGRDGEPTGGVFNYAKMNSAASTKVVLDKTARALDSVIEAKIDTGTKSLDDMHAEAVRDVADMLEFGEGELLANIAKTADNIKDTTKHLLAGKMMMQSVARDIEALGANIASDIANPQEVLQFVDRIHVLGDLEASVKAIQTTSARTTVAGRIRTGDDFILNGTEFLERIREAGGPDAIKKVAQDIQAAKGNTKAVRKIANRHLKGGPLAMVREFFINAILSGPKTHLVNMTSNTIQTFMMPIERMAGARNIADFKEGALMFTYATSGMLDIVRAAWKSKNLPDFIEHGADTTTGQALRALRQGDNVLDPGNAKVDGHTQAIRTNSTGAAGTVANSLGSIIRTPTRFLMAEDEFFKQVNYRAALRAKLHRRAADQFPADAAKRAGFIEDGFVKGFDENGRGIDVEALDYARKSTFTNPLKFDTIGSSVQQFSARHPAFSLIVPFVRTPTNIIRNVIARTPFVQFAQKEFREDLKAGGRLAADARGKIAMGSALYGSAIALTMQGKITGGGPKDPAKKGLKMQTGWRPYSYVHTNEKGVKVHTSFARLDPQGMFFGIVADLADVGNHLDEGEYTELAGAALIAVAKNLTSKTYLSGISEAINAMSAPDRNMERWLKRSVSAFVPTGLRQLSESVGATNDPYMRETRSILDAVIQKIPGLSSTLPKKVSWVTGEAIKYPGGFFFPDSVSPYAQSEGKADIVLDELAALNHGWKAPSRFIGETEMNGKQYQRFQELHGTVKIDGQTLMQKLKDEFQSEEYDIDRKRVPDTNDRFTSHRIATVDRWIGRFRKAAQQDLIAEDAALESKVFADKDTARAVKTGDKETIKRLIEQQ